MHRTDAGEKRKALKREARELARKAKKQKEARAIMHATRSSVMRLQALADKRLSEAQALKLEARLEDLHVWEQKRVKDTKKGPRTYGYRIASWREGNKVHNVYLGSGGKISREQAQEKARALKREALGLSSPPEDGN